MRSERKYFHTSRLAIIASIIAAVLSIVSILVYSSAEGPKLLTSLGFFILIILFVALDRARRGHIYRQIEKKVEDDEIDEETLMKQLLSIKESGSDEREIAGLKYGSTTVSGTTTELESFIQETIEKKKKQ